MWQIGLVLVGFPILYLLNSFAPWSVRLFGRGDHAAFFPFFASILTLHWLSAATVLLLLRGAGVSLTQLGLRVSGKRALVLAGKVVIVGVVVVAVRELAGYAAPRPRALASFPRGFAENLFFVPVAISAGFCEELVYRGFGITTLVGRGLRSWQAVILSSFSFVFIHGLGGLYAFPVFFTGGQGQAILSALGWELHLRVGKVTGLSSGKVPFAKLKKRMKREPVHSFYFRYSCL